MSSKPLPRPALAGARPGDDIPDLLLTWFIQVTGLAAALIFGVFAVLSWVDSQEAKAQARAANLIAIAAICAQIHEASNEAMQAICGPFFSNAWPDLEAAVGGLLPYVPTRTALGTTAATATTTTTTTTTTMTTSTTHGTSSVFASPPPPSSSFTAPGSGAPSSSAVRGSSTALETSVGAPSTASFSIPHGGHTTSAFTSATSGPTAGAAPGSHGAGTLSTSSQKIGLGVGLGVGLITLVVSGLTVWKMRRRRTRAVYEPVDVRQEGVDM